jgi:Asp-tRNA(Asn)/Glu-tRNA(Gln) amidotransferase A subunit family amidase
LILGKEFDAIPDDQVAINDYEVARALAFEYECHRDKLSAPIREIVERGYRVSRERYEVALRNAIGYRASFAQTMKNYDFVLTPAAAGEAPEGLAQTGSASFNRLWTLLGVPCLTVPAYKGPGGLPIGVQIVGAYGSDRDTLAWAQWTRRTLEEHS